MSEQPDPAAVAMMVGERVLERTQTHPLSTVAGAAVAGYILARGVPTIMLRLGISMALRVVGARVLQELSDRTSEDSEDSDIILQPD